MPIIMGTAGHIDHGKTTLIKALSGIDCDRLKDEKKRGITIELGFAFLDLPDGQRIGIIDVPGHEKFVKNMVAGAAGIDFVLLTVAADEGIMPQTKEHLEICSLLGITEGLVALTKMDTVDSELLELAQEEVHDYLSSTFLAHAPVIPVSAHTGAGLPELTQALQELSAKSRENTSSQIFRLPIDRVFTMRGHGTVITGTLIDGRISVGENIAVYPREIKTKVRGLQVHGQTVETAHAGQRTAMNVAGLEVENLQRGECLAKPGTLFPSTLWDVEISLLSTATKPLKHRREIHFHHGTKETLARVYLLDRDQLEPGEICLAQVRFPEPMAGIFGDRYVIRAFSPLRTIAGGIILSPMGIKVRRRSQDLDSLQALRTADHVQRVLTHLHRAGKTGLTGPELHVLTAMPDKHLDRTLQDLTSKQQIFLFDREEQRYVSRQLIEDLSTGLLEHVRTFHHINPMKPGISRGMLSTGWGRGLSPKLLHFVIERCLKKKSLVTEKEVLRLPEHSISLATDQSQLKEDLLSTYDQAGMQPPNFNTVLESLNVSKKEALGVMDLLIGEGKLVKINDSLYFSAQAVDQVRKLIFEHFAAHAELSPTDFKELTGLSRKYSIPLLEYLDRQKLTMRIGDVRKLRKGQ
jgi:selenocysteine-specific elongation factor